MKKLAIFDIDGVIYDGHSIFDIVQDQEKKKLIPTGTWDKILFELGEYKSGKKNYKQAADSMLATHATALKGSSYKDIIDHNYNYFMENKNKFFPYFKNLSKELSRTHDLYFVTTNFQFGAEAVGKIFGIKNYLSSIAELKGNTFTGKVELSLGGNKGIVSNLIKKYGREGSIAVGDSENDIDMLDKVKFPFAMEPDEKMAKIARERSWTIVDRKNIALTILNLV